MWAKNIKSRLGLNFLFYLYCNDLKFTQLVENSWVNRVATYFVRKLHYDG
jgi:hypothetical protein